MPFVGRDSSVGIATRYGMDAPEIESLWGARFPVPIQTGPGAHPGYQDYTSTVLVEWPFKGWNNFECRIV